jgi:hypothetical protein
VLAGLVYLVSSSSFLFGEIGFQNAPETVNMQVATLTSIAVINALSINSA